MKKKRSSWSQTRDFQQVFSRSGSEIEIIDLGRDQTAGESPEPDNGLSSSYPIDIEDESLSNSSKGTPKPLSPLFSLREKIGIIMESKIVEGIVLTMIIINAIMMGISTFDIISANKEVSEIFDITDGVFTIIFTVESCLRLFFMGYRFFTDSWALFDFILVAISWVPASGGVKAMRALRILRVLTKVQMLKEVISNIILVMPKMGAVALLLMLIMFIFSILFTQLFGDMYENGETEVDYFSRLDLTFLTLWQLMTLDGWNDLVREIMETYPWAWVPLFIYINLTGIVVTNIVIAIICDSVLQENQKEEKEEMADKVDLRIKKMQSEIIAIRDVLEKKLNPGIGFEHMRLASMSAVRVSDHDNVPLIMQANEMNIGNSNLLQPKGIRQRTGELVNNEYVQHFIMALIVSNSILMAVATFDFDPSILSIFDTIDTVFLSIYTLESVMQIFYHGHRITKDGWATFDLILVITSWAFYFTPIPVQAARSLRIIRLLRVIPKLKSLKVIITAVVKVTPKLIGIGGMLSLLFYISAIIFTILFKDYPLTDDYFTRLDTTMFTLFQIMTMADWAEISRELAVFVPWAPLLVGFFLVVSGFIFLNLIIALICEAMGSIDEITIEIFDDEQVAESWRSMPFSNSDRMQYIEDSQKYILDVLKTCTITSDYKDSLMLKNPLPQSNENLSEIFYDATSERPKSARSISSQL